jgi:hypothetical protein
MFNNRGGPNGPVHGIPKRAHQKPVLETEARRGTSNPQPSSLEKKVPDIEARARPQEGMNTCFLDRERRLITACLFLVTQCTPFRCEVVSNNDGNVATLPVVGYIPGCLSGT